MKRVMCLILAAALVLGLAACEERKKVSPYGEDDFGTDSPVILVTENRSYDKSVESFTYWVSNYGEEPVTFSTDYTVEVKEGETWYSLPQAEEMTGSGGETETVAPGETVTGKFSFWQYDYTVVDGEYRLIMDIGGSLHRAYFSIGSSTALEEDPYGYGTLESLPTELDLDSLTYDIAISSAGEVIGGSEEHVITFLRKAADGADGMLRIVSYGLSGQPVLYDIVYEDGCFLCRKDATRDGGETITQQRYSYLVTDGDYIYLSDQASLEEKDLAGRRIEANRFAILTGSGFSLWDAMVELVKQMTEERLAKDAALARYWSADGTYWVNLTADPKDYTVSSKKHGMSRTLTEFSQLEEERGAEMEIVSAVWTSETQVRLSCRLRGNDEETWYVTFDAAQET